MTTLLWACQSRGGVPGLGHADGGVLMPAVEMPAHLDDDVFAGEGARHAQRHERGLGAGGDKLDLAAIAATGDQLLDQLAPLNFQGVAGTVVAALLDLL